MDLSFKFLYGTYYKKVYNTCLMILKNPSLAEEATQESFINAYKKIDTLKDPTKFGSWIASIAAKYSLNLYNRNKKILYVEKDDVLDLFVNVSKNMVDPEEILEQKELNRELRTAINKLKPLQSQIIILKYYWELTEQEIAETLEIPVGTVKSSLYRAKKYLAKILTTASNEHHQVRTGIK